MTASELPEPSESPDDAYDWARAAQHKASQDFDKVIVTLATGALAISLVFVHDVAPQPQERGLLIAAWALFVLSLLSVVISLLTSMHALDVEMSGGSGAGGGSKWGWTTGALNWVAGISLVVGVALLTAFASLNL